MITHEMKSFKQNKKITNKIRKLQTKQEMSARLMITYKAVFSPS